MLREHQNRPAHAQQIDGAHQNDTEAPARSPHWRLCLYTQYWHRRSP
jgi:hypothetical protein